MKPFLPVFIWALLILALSVGTGVQMPEVIFSPDKIGHFLFYGVLSWLSARALLKKGLYSRKTIWLSTGLICGYGILLEFVQWAFFPNRFFEVWDLIANATGTLVAILAFHFFIFKT